MDRALLGRNMVNGDNNSFFYTPDIWQPEGERYSAQAIDRFVERLARTGIDTFLICPNCQLPCYPSKRLRYQFEDYRRGDREYFRAHFEGDGYPPEAVEAIVSLFAYRTDKFLDLVEDGVDWLAECSAACRRHGIVPWLSVRMNDSHGGNTPETSFMNNDLLKNHLELCLDKPCIDPRFRFERYSLDFGQKACRDYMMEIIADLLDNYDYEGMELDFTRDPVILKPVASDAGRAMITGWIWEIRQMTREKARRMGKPFYLGLKASLRTGMLYDYGLDVDRLVREGLVDFIGLSNTFQTSWHADIDAQKRRYGDSVAVYGYMEGAINWLQVLANPEAGRSAEQSRKRGRDMAYSGEYLLGNAAGKLVLGADGLIQYNNFIERDAGAKSSQAEWALRGLSDLESLRGRPKAYSMESAFFDPLGSVALEAPWTLPEWIAPSHCRAFRLPMCTEPQEAGLKLLVELIVERKRTESRPAVSINGHFPSAEYIKTDRILFASGDYGTLLPEHEGFVFSFSTAAIEEGWNEITVFNLVKEKADGAENGAETFRLMSLEIGIMSGEDARAIVGAHTGAEQA